MAPRLHSAALVALVVLVTVCSLHVDHVAAVNCRKTCSKNMRCKSSGRNGLKKCRSYPNAIPTCKDGCCSAKCKPGYADCNRDMALDGCETFIAGEDRSNCGGCGTQCKEDQFPFSVASCTKGKCGIFWCYPGRTDCNQKVKDGCEADTDNDWRTCGGCGSPCPVHPNTVPACYNEWCRYACKEGFTYCYDSNEIDERGCTSLNNDVKNCGRCHKVCGAGQSCQKGTCK